MLPLLLFTLSLAFLLFTLSLFLDLFSFSLCLPSLRLISGVVDQIIDGEDPPCNEPLRPYETDPDQALCRFQDRVDVYKMEAGLSVGPVFARHIGHRLYRGEYYY